MKLRVDMRLFWRPRHLPIRYRRAPSSGTNLGSRSGHTGRRDAQVTSLLVDDSAQQRRFRGKITTVTVAFTRHARTRMFQRRIPVADVEAVVRSPECVVEDYPDDRPFPSRLVLGWVGREPLHVHFAVDAPGGRLIVVTTYRPSPDRWQSDFTRRVP